LSTDLLQKGFWQILAVTLDAASPPNRSALANDSLLVGLQAIKIRVVSKCVAIETSAFDFDGGLFV
jgi:hypothetical protein